MIVVDMVTKDLEVIIQKTAIAIGRLIVGGGSTCHSSIDVFADSLDIWTNSRIQTNADRVL